MNCVRKQGSCELNSRLKTRKLLGVGETNDGEVHRSKLSQILGHSEQLYFKEIKGLRFWQLFSSLLYSCIALSEFLCPGSILSRPQATSDDGTSNAAAGVDPLTARLYAAALFSLSVLLWRSFLSVDRELIRVSLLTSLIYSIFHLIVCTVGLLWSSWSSRDQIFVVFFSLEFIQLIVMLIFFAVSLYFYRSTTK